MSEDEEDETIDMLKEAKKVLRIENVDNDAINTEIQDLIEDCKKDLISIGLDETKIVETDIRIKRTILIYVKAHFGDNPNFERLNNLYLQRKRELDLSNEYKEVETNDSI